MFFFDINLFKMIILSYLSKSKVLPFNEIENNKDMSGFGQWSKKIEKAVYSFTSGWKKDLMVIRRCAMKPKSLQGGLE